MNKFFIIPILLLGILLLVAVFYLQGMTHQNQSFFASGTQAPKPSKQVPAVTTLATNLNVPWALTFLPEGSMLITERGGTVREVNKDGKLLENPIMTIPDIIAPGSTNGLSNESGLLGITISPHFSEDHYVYFFYTYKMIGENIMNRVVRYRFNNNSFTDEKIILDAIPGSVRHDGGRIKFGPDGYLYVTTGDALNPSHAQDKDSLAGKILRMTMDGKPIPSNPFYKEVINPEKDEPRTYIYTYGNRNPQGITWDDNGQLWEVEHGDVATDEFNKIVPGANYGWPVITGNQTRPGMVTPVLQSRSVTWAPSDLAYYNHHFYFGGLKGQTLYQVTVTGDTASLKEYFTNSFGRIREVIMGPDQMMYLLTSNRDGRGTPQSNDDKLIRINPSVFND